MSFSLSTLPNGLRVLTHPSADRRCYVAIAVDVGAIDESETENGISHLLEHLLFKETPTRPIGRISSDVEDIGAQINAATSPSDTTYFASGLEDDMETCFDVLADMVKNAILSDANVEFEKSIVLAEIAETSSDPAEQSDELMRSIAFRDHPAGRPVAGTPESVKAITPVMVRSFRERKYGADRFFVLAWGGADHQTFVARVEAALGDLKAAQEPQQRQSLVFSGGVEFKTADEENVALTLSYEVEGPLDRHGYATAVVLSNMLGGSASSILFTELRERRGLCYSIASYVHSPFSSESSLFTISTMVPPDGVQATWDFLQEALRRCAAGEFTDKDFKRAIHREDHALVFDAAHPFRVLSDAVMNIRTYGEIVSLDEKLAIFNAVTRQDVMSLAGRLLTQDVAIGGYGADAALDVSPRQPIMVA